MCHMDSLLIQTVNVFRKEAVKKKNDRTTMEATEHTNSSLEDFVKHNGMTDPLAQTTETLKNFYQREKNKEKT